MLDFMTGVRHAHPLLLLLLLTVPGLSHARGVYQTPEAFLGEAFNGEIPPAQRLWLSGELGDIYREVVQESPNQLRLRYWQHGERIAWILQAIGKEHPITAGFIVERGQMLQARVLEFRESRGWEIRYPFFTEQFRQIGLAPGQRLDKEIDGITGATLSVRAMTNMARMALVLAAKVTEKHDEP